MPANHNLSQPRFPLHISQASIADKLRLQHRLAVAWSIVYAIAAVGTLAPCAAIMLLRFSQWIKALPNGVEPTLTRLVSDRPDILLTSCLGGLIGVVLAAGGMLTWLYLLGRHNAPPKKVVFVIGGMPIALGCVGVLLTAAKPGLVGLVAAPLMLGATVALVPMLIGLMAIGLQQLALNFVGQMPLECDTTELPPDVARYFDQFDAAAKNAGLEFAGNFCFVPKRSKFRRVWIAANGAYFVDATHFSLGSTTIRALSVSSATEDGHYFSTTDLAEPTLPATRGLEHCLQLPNAPLASLIERHVQTIGEWVGRTGSRPLIFNAADQHQLFAYGLAANMQQDQNELMWLANPYRNQPLPPLPGQVWQEQEEVSGQMATAPQ